MSKVIGIEKKVFTPKNSNTPVEGITVHISEPILSDRGAGVSTDNFFLSAQKVKQLPFTPTVGMDIEVLYNKWGRVVTLRLLDDMELA